MFVQDILFSSSSGTPIEDVTLECPDAIESPPSAVGEATLEVTTLSAGDNDTLSVLVELASDTASITSFQFTLVGLGCVEDVSIISAVLSAGQGSDCKEPSRAGVNEAR